MTALALGSGCNVNNSFSDSTESITHDSGPSLLEFEAISGAPNTGEGIVISNLGTTLDLSSLQAIGSSFSTFKFDDWASGGQGRIFYTFHLNGPYPTFIFDNWTSGTGVAAFTVNFTDSTSFTFTITYSQIRNFAILAGRQTTSAWLFDLSSYAPASLVPYVGKTIANVVTNVSTAFTSPIGGQIDQAGSGINLRIATSSLLGHDLTTGNHTDTLGQPVGSGDSISLNVVVNTTTGNHYSTTAGFNIDKNGLKAQADAGGQGLLHVADISMAGYSIADLSSYAGAVIDSIDWNVTQDFESAIPGQLNQATSSLRLKYNGSYVVPSKDFTAGSGSTATGLGITILNAVPFIIATTATTSSSTYPNIVMTEPYELRLRNLPAFKLKIGGSVGETPPSFRLGAFVSQGALNDETNVNREWCPIPLDVIAATGATLDVAYPAVISTGQGMTSLPSGFCGAMVLVPKEYVGPWNYIRFVISLIPPGTGADFAGITLTITANAREL